MKYIVRTGDKKGATNIHCIEGDSLESIVFDAAQTLSTEPVTTTQTGPLWFSVRTENGETVGSVRPIQRLLPKTGQAETPES